MKRSDCRWTPVVVALTLVALSGQVLGQSEFHAAVDRARASQSEAIRLTLTLTSTVSLNHVPSPNLDLSAFDVFGPTVSTVTNLINGRMSFARELVYTLYGRKVGRFRIGPVLIQLGEETLATEAIDVEIVRRNRASGTAANGAQQRMEDVTST